MTDDLYERCRWRYGFGHVRFGIWIRGELECLFFPLVSSAGFLHVLVESFDMTVKTGEESQLAIRWEFNGNATIVVQLDWRADLLTSKMREPWDNLGWFSFFQQKFQARSWLLPLNKRPQTKHPNHINHYLGSTGIPLAHSIAQPERISYSNICNYL